MQKRKESVSKIEKYTGIQTQRGNKSQRNKNNHQNEPLTDQNPNIRIPNAVHPPSYEVGSKMTNSETRSKEENDYKFDPS